MLRAARPPGGVRRRGVVRRHARGEGVRGAADAARAGAREARGARAVLEGLHPRHRAGVPRERRSSSSASFIAPTWQALIDGARYVDPRLVEIFDELAPDVIVEDNVCAFPAIPASGRPWVRIVSATRSSCPTRRSRRRSPGCPTRRPLGLGRSSAPSTPRRIGEMQASFTAFCVERGAPPLPSRRDDPRVAVAEPDAVPGRARLRARARRSAPTWHNLETCVRAHRRGVGAARAAGGRRADLRQPRLARLGRRRR